MTNNIHPIFQAALASVAPKAGEAQVRTLKALHQSLFAPTFRALETMGEPPPPEPTLDDVKSACIAAIEFHERKASGLAAEIYQLCTVNPTNLTLLQEAVETRKHHLREIARIKSELDAMTQRAAE